MMASKKKTATDDTMAGNSRMLREDAEEQLARSPKVTPDFERQTPKQLIHELQVHQIELETQAEELRRTLIALEESRDKYLDLYDFAPISYLTLSEKALVIGVNLAGAMLLNIERSNLVNAQFTKYVAEKDLLQWGRYFASLLRQGQKQTCHLLLMTREDGSVFPAQVEGIRITGSHGVTTVRIAINDITDIIKEEEDREERGVQYREFFTISRDCVFITSPGGKWIDFNDATLELFGYKSREELSKISVTSLYAQPGKRSAFNSLVERNGYVKEYPLQLKQKDGTVIHTLITSVPVRNPDGSLKAFMGTIRDITARKATEGALSQANKKLTLLSSITRNDINNQLTVQMGYLELLKDSKLDPTQEEYLQNVNTTAKRISALVRFTREYEEIGVQAPVWQDISTIVDNATKDAHPGDVLVNNDLIAGSEVFADPDFVRVCYNLVDNAVRYGGKITTIRFFMKACGADQVIVCEDDGDGVVAGAKEKIFERGFGKNSGLGLALSREILSITGITIKETGEPGKGARFEMTVPNGIWRFTGRIT